MIDFDSIWRKQKREPYFYDSPESSFEAYDRGR